MKRRKPTMSLVKVRPSSATGIDEGLETHKIPWHLAVMGRELLLRCHDGIHRCVVVVVVLEENAKEAA